MPRIVFIGGGNMAKAIVGGMIDSGRPSTDIVVVDPNETQRQSIANQYGVDVTDDPGAAINDANIIVLAVKPQAVEAVAKQMKAVTSLDGKLLVSILAGTSMSTLEANFGEIAIVRTMPNTPALLGLGATGLFANALTTAEQLSAATEIIQSFGICVPVDREDLLDAVTAVSGSGPAYFFLMIEEMVRVGVALGLSPDDAKALTLQTALGASSMAARGDVAPDELRRRVTSPNGTTHAAITTFEMSGFGQTVENAMTACRDRALELAKG